MTEQKQASIIARKHAKIFGIALNSTHLSEVIAYVKYRIENKVKFSIVTPNPEIILASIHDQKLKEAINGSLLVLPDGIGLAQANRFLMLSTPKNKGLKFVACVFQGLSVGGATLFKKDWLTKSLNILPGRKIFLELVSLANKNSWKVFLMGGYNGISQKVVEKLKRKYKNVKFEYVDGPNLNEKGDPDTKVDTLIQKGCLEKINKFKPELLFVAFGPVKQEKWIAKNLSKLEIGCAMAVGGTFNYVGGLSKLPPKWIEGLGLEWLWRLFTEPWRARRVFNAFPIFPLKVFWYKFKQNV